MPRLNATRWIRVWSAAAVLALATSACTHPSKSASGGPAMTLQMSQGSATVAGGGKTQNVTGQAPIGQGYRVVVAPDSLAVLRLSEGRTFELTDGEVSITGPDRIQLVRGAALGDLSASGQIETEGLAVSSDSGTFRVTRGDATRVGVIAGKVTMSVPGSTLEVPAFREAVVTSGVLPSAPRPLEILNGGDVWDQRYLRDAIDLDARLANFSGGLDAQLGNATGLQFFRLVIADPAELAHVQPFLAQPRSEVLIGLVIANAAGRPDPQATFDQIMGQWLAGESWGLIAMEYHVAAQDVFSGLLAAIRKVGISLTTPSPRIGPIPVPTQKPKVVAGPKPKTSPAPKGTLLPTPVPTPSPTGLLNQVLDPITNLLTQILTLLLPQPPTSTATPAAAG
jgi:hypothetical protein